ncbi:hypothetical protein HA402_001862 [Bradysia odoriphaga]|nr:hypothetical protein HA402_001862 [Bradysia odoriphaga]
MNNLLTDKEIQMLNARCVMTALDSLNHHATENKILSYFQTASDESAVEQELKRILELGVKNGFIVRNGDKYALASLESDYEIDGDESDSGSDVEVISPKIPRYEVFSSPTADEAGTAYRSIARHSPPRKRKYTKRKAEPTDRLTRSTSRALPPSAAGPGTRTSSRVSTTSRASTSSRAGSSKKGNQWLQEIRNHRRNSVQEQ